MLCQSKGISSLFLCIFIFTLSHISWALVISRASCRQYYKAGNQNFDGNNDDSEGDNDDDDDKILQWILHV